MSGLGSLPPGLDSNPARLDPTDGFATCESGSAPYRRETSPVSNPCSGLNPVVKPRFAGLGTPLFHAQLARQASVDKMCLACGSKMRHEGYKAGEIVWEDIERAGRNWELRAGEAIHNSEEQDKLAKK